MNYGVPVMNSAMVPDMNMRIDYLMGIINRQDGAIRMLIERVENGERRDEDLRNKNVELEKRVKELEDKLDGHKKVAVYKRNGRKSGKYIPPALRVRDENGGDYGGEERLRMIWSGSNTEDSGRATPLYFGRNEKDNIW